MPNIRKHPLPDISELKRCLSYNPFTGRVIWKVKKAIRVQVGDRAGKVNGHGYRYISFNDVSIKEHRIIWALMNGEWPPAGMEIDHKNGIRSDNRWENLRLATKQQNMANSVRSTTTGFKGVQKKGNRFVATLGYKYKKLHLGSFGTAEEARDAYLSKAHELIGAEFVKQPLMPQDTEES